METAIGPEQLAFLAELRAYLDMAARSLVNAP